MSALIRMPRAAWRRQPQGPVQVNCGNSITNQLSVLLPLRDRNDVTNLVTREVATPTAGVTNATYAGGKAVYLSAVPDCIDFVNPASITSSTQPLTVSWIQQPINPTGFSVPVAWKPTGATYQLLIAQTVSGSDSNYYFVVGPTATVSSLMARFSESIGAMVNRKIDHYVVVIPGGAADCSSAKLWRNGIAITRNTSTDYNNFGTDTNTLSRIGSADSNTHTFYGLIHQFAIWGRALSDAEAQSVGENPYQLFAPRPARFFLIPDAAGGGGGTISLTGLSGTGSIGSFSLSGGSIQTLSGLLGTGQIGVVTTSGEAIQTLSGLLGTGSTGILTLSGSATQTISGLSSAGVLGTATTSGDAIQSLSGLLGTGNAGVFTTSGTANQTLSGLTGTGTVGSFTLSGNAAVALPAVLISSALGVITASAGGNIAVTLSGVAATPFVGGFTLTSDALKALTGVLSTSEIGVSTASGGAAHSLFGVNGTGTSGSVSCSASALLTLLGVSSTSQTGILTLSSGSSITLNGLSASGSLGIITVSAGNDGLITLSGNASLGYAGSLVLQGDSLMYLPGVSAIGRVGHIGLTEVFTPGGNVLIVSMKDRTLIVSMEDRVLKVIGG